MEFWRPICIYRLEEIYDRRFLETLPQDDLTNLCKVFETQIPSYEEAVYDLYRWRTNK